ncbi:TrkA family potassium uptake protein [Brooklawnia cerclae]|uniref:Trk system potassium uptake protein TrkA n=1 Tax=Brooklawnia cerclae TaxID=349934 RepID=A0ABX0SG29_9ACTN|nr:TrkA family potassium uptake protein [Brooklawnia cerclae]NIH56941.1 trk system potassium uptake protein TrkA [Brooklawnia cerclae]
MRVCIVGAGNVGRSIARELIANGHEVLLIERDPHAIKSDTVPEAEWLLADACEMDSLEEADLQTCDVSIAATGDDKANLVHTLLAKTEFGVPRTVARVNHPGNEWLFDDQWGVDVAVSTPRIMSALVEEAVSVGEIVRLLTFKKGASNLIELRLPDDSPAVGKRVRDIEWPMRAVLVAVIRDGTPSNPEPDAALEAADELLFVSDPEAEALLHAMLAPKSEPPVVSRTAAPSAAIRRAARRQG